MRKETAIEHFGGIPALAKRLGLTRHAIYMWGDVIPKLRAIELDYITEGALKFDPSFYSKAS